MTILESPYDLTILGSAQITKLEKDHAKQVFNIEDLLAEIPRDAIRSWKSYAILTHDPILPYGGIGVDPGINLGLSYVADQHTAYTLSLSVDRGDVSSADLLGVFHRLPLLLPEGTEKVVPVVVEGAAYNARYGQPLLGAIRGVIIVGFSIAGYETVVEMPPLSIRKKVFGNGRVQPKDFWNIGEIRGFNKDAADAFSMALAAGI